MSAFDSFAKFPSAGMVTATATVTAAGAVADDAVGGGGLQLDLQRPTVMLISDHLSLRIWHNIIRVNLFLLRKESLED